jgi:hypothetical protein
MANGYTLNTETVRKGAISTIASSAALDAYTQLYYNI